LTPGARTAALCLAAWVTFRGGPLLAQASEKPPVEGGKIVAGAALAFGLHELGHVAAAWGFDADPGLKGIKFGGVPFFAITHRNGLSPRREYVVSSAGFWSQHLVSEKILTQHPRLRLESRSIEKGMLAFHVVTSFAYAGAALARTGPAERDTRGMAQALRVDERWVGLLVFAPAALDVYRYFRPEARWAAWGSRGVKIGMASLAIK
jgi:hypothetical protein